MNRLSAISTMALCCVALAQSHVPIKGTKNTRLAPAVRDAVAMGGVKDSMRCDAAHNIYTPVPRGYSTSFGSIVEITADGKQFRRFPLDGILGLDTGGIEDFEVTDAGLLYVLAREVTKYSDLQVPLAFGSAHVLKFDSVGRLERQTKLDADFGEMRPTSLAVLRDGDFLVAGYSYWPDKTVSMFVDLFSSEGKLKKKAPIPRQRTQAANGETVSSMSVLRPTTIKSGRRVFVLRGSTRDPIYSFSDTGEFVGTIKLRAENIEFSSPTIYDHQLIVHQHKAARKSGALVPLYGSSTKSGTVLTEAEPDVFPVFDLDSGALVQQFEWRQAGELACYDGSGLTIVHQDFDFPSDSYWTIIEAQPSTATSAPRSEATDADITLQLRWIVPCGGDKIEALPLHRNEAAQRACLSPGSIVNDSDIESAEAYVNELNEAALRLRFTLEGSQKLGAATSGHENAELAIVINGEVVLLVLVMEPIGHEMVISSRGLNQEELSGWAARLNAKARRQMLKKAT